MTAHMDGITSAGNQRPASSLARLARKSAIMGSTAIALAFVASAAQAQCVFGNSPNGGGIGNAVQPAVLGANTLNSIVGSITSLNVAFQTQTSAFIGSPGNPEPGQLGGGSWIRGIGGRTDLGATTNGTFSFGTPASTGALNCATSSRTDFAGFQVGQDIARLNLGGWNMFVGATGGYAETEGRTGLNETRFQVPFAGIYAAITGGGGFFLDGQARWDFYQMSLSEPTQQVRQQQFDARGFSFASSAGYNMRLGNNYFLEPSVGVVVSRTSVDNVNLNSLVGGFVVNVPGTLSFGDVKSTLARASLRAGTSFNAGGITLSPYGVVSVFHDFEGKSTANYTTQCVATGQCAVVPGPEFTTSLNSSSVGTFGQYSLGITGQVSNTGWLGYARVDFRKGDNIEGVGVNGGLRYQFTPPTRSALSARF
jgi:hypothetical protein